MNTSLQHLISPAIKDGNQELLLQAADAQIQHPILQKLFIKDPQTCLSEALPIMIAEYSLEEFIEEGLVEQAIRDLLSAGPVLHSIKGTMPGIQYALDRVGVSASVVEWFETEPEGKPGTHQITVDVNQTLFEGTAVIDDKTIAQIWRLINVMKRWSQKTYLRIALKMTSTVGMASVIKAANMVKLDHSGITPAQSLASVATVGVIAIGVTHINLTSKDMIWETRYPRYLQA